MSRRPSVSSIASSGFHPSRSASPAFSTSTLEPHYGGSRPVDRLRMQTGHVQAFPYNASIHHPSAAEPHTGGKVSKKKRDDRRQFSKRAAGGTTSSRIQKSDNEAGNRFCQAIDFALAAKVCREANPNIEHNAAPRYGGKKGWNLLKQNNINHDVREEGVEPSLWNKSCVNGSAIAIIDQSNQQLDDMLEFNKRLRELRSTMTSEQIWELQDQYMEALAQAKVTRGAADWQVASQRLT